MDDRPGNQPAQPPDSGAQSGADAPPPRGFSFPDATDASGHPAGQEPTFSYPDDAQPTGGRHGQPPPAEAPRYASPEYGQPPGSAFGGPQASDGQPPPAGGGGYGQPPPAGGGGYGQPPPAPTSGGYGNPWGPENAGPGSGAGPGHGPWPAAHGYATPASEAGPGWAASGPDPSALGFGGRPPAGFGNQPAGPNDRQALIAMVVGLSSTVLALAGCCYLGPRIVALLAGVAAIVVGILAQQRISKSAGRLSGMPQAVIGIASGAVAIFLSLLVALVTLLN